MKKREKERRKRKEKEEKGNFGNFLKKKGYTNKTGATNKNRDKIIGLTIGDELRVSNIQDRMINMINNAEAFIALLGGFGTLEEIFHVVTWSQLNIHQKPVGLLNVNGFFDGLLSFMDYSVEKGFISAIARKLIIVAETPQDLINKLQDFVHKTDPYLTQVVWTGIDNRRKRKLDLSLTL